MSANSEDVHRITSNYGGVVPFTYNQPRIAGQPFKSSLLPPATTDGAYTLTPPAPNPNAVESSPDSGTQAKAQNGLTFYPNTLPWTPDEVSNALISSLKAPASAPSRPRRNPNRNPHWMFAGALDEQGFPIDQEIQSYLARNMPDSEEERRQFRAEVYRVMLERAMNMPAGPGTPEFLAHQLALQRAGKSVEAGFEKAPPIVPPAAPAPPVPAVTEPLRPPRGLGGYPDRIPAPATRGLGGYPDRIPAPATRGPGGYPDRIPAPATRGPGGYPDRPNREPSLGELRWAPGYIPTLEDFAASRMAGRGLQYAPSQEAVRRSQVAVDNYSQPWHAKQRARAEAPANLSSPFQGKSLAQRSAEARARRPASMVEPLSVLRQRPPGGV